MAIQLWSLDPNLGLIDPNQHAILCNDKDSLQWVKWGHTYSGSVTPLLAPSHLLPPSGTQTSLLFPKQTKHALTSKPLHLLLLKALKGLASDVHMTHFITFFSSLLNSHFIREASLTTHTQSLFSNPCSTYFLGSLGRLWAYFAIYYLSLLECKLHESKDFALLTAVITTT